MENNAEEDLARHENWLDYSRYYEAKAGDQINEIESGMYCTPFFLFLKHVLYIIYHSNHLSDHLLSVLLDIPLSDIGKQKVPLLEIALEQNRIVFLNSMLPYNIPRKFFL